VLDAKRNHEAWEKRFLERKAAERPADPGVTSAPAP